MHAAVWLVNVNLASTLYVTERSNSIHSSLISGESRPSDKAGTRSSRAWDKGRGGRSPKKLFRPFGHHFGRKIRGGPGSATAHDIVFFSSVKPKPTQYATDKPREMLKAMQERHRYSQGKVFSSFLKKPFMFLISKMIFYDANRCPYSKRPNALSILIWCFLCSFVDYSTGLLTS